MILDTNAVSALFAGDAALAALLSGVSRHHLPTIVVGEYRFGLQRSRHRQELSELLEALAGGSIVLPVDLATAAHYGAVREELRGRGTPIPENDVWIAALARQHGLAIASRDGHFDLVPGIERRSW